MGRAEYDMMPNYKILQQAFKSGIPNHIEIEKLIKGKYQDNLEMFQWMKSYYENTYDPGAAEYDAPSRRFGDVQDWAFSSGTPAPSASRSPPASAGSQRRSPVTRRESTRVSREDRGTLSTESMQAFEVMKRDNDQLREEIVDLKITVDGLEVERDFYFQKLRDIEILCQEIEVRPEPGLSA